MPLRSSCGYMSQRRSVLKDRPLQGEGDFYDNASRNAFEAAVRDLGARVKRIEVAVSGLKPSIAEQREQFKSESRTAAASIYRNQSF